MGIFSNSSPFDQDVDKVTDENNTSEDWGAILEICDRAGASAAAAKDCLRAALRRLAHPDPHVAVQAATLIDACVANCGRVFLLEVASRDFCAEFRRVLGRAQPDVARRLRALLRKWAEGEFRDDPQLDLVPSLYAALRDAEPSPSPAAANSLSAATPAADAAAARREQDELARAIALSLRDTQPASVVSTAALYPRVDVDSTPPAVLASHTSHAPPARKVRALYDFEAAEDNELTFLAGEIVFVTDAGDPNWWKGYNERGEGLFPANFVTADLEPPPPVTPAAQATHFERPPDEVVEIDEGAMDSALALLLEADPEAPESVEAEARLREAEGRVCGQGALIDAALERADTRHARLTQLSAELVDALNLYHLLMRDPGPPVTGPALYHAPPPAHFAPHGPR